MSGTHKQSMESATSCIRAIKPKSIITRKKLFVVACLTLLASGFYLISKVEHSTVWSVKVPFNGTIRLDDVCLTIKTSKKFHSSRLEVVLQTWFRTAKGQVYIITDDDDKNYQRKTGNKLVTSKCGSTNGLYDLCCKVGLTYDTFMEDREKRWWCYFDDDNYVHIDRLLQYLNLFDSNKEVYIGKRSLPTITSSYKGKLYEYQFGTGGAGVCITRPLAERMKPWIGMNVFPRTCGEINAADDCAIGFVITQLLVVNLTESMFFHSHFETFKDFETETLDQQITFSYRGDNVLNLPDIDAKFTNDEDPTRLLSLHCYLYTQDELCKAT